MASTLVTGGAGFIGSCFARQWVAEESSQVVVLDKLTYAGNLESLQSVWGHARFAFERGDIADFEWVLWLLRKYGVASVVNFAAESHVDRSIDGPAPFVMTNVVGSFQLLEASRRYWNELTEPDRSRFRFLQVSTDEVYGSLGPQGQFTESTPYAPNSPYSASKACADHFVRAYHRTYGLPVVITNCSNNFGPYQFPEKLIPRIIRNALEGKPLPIFGDGRHVRDWLFVEDHCSAIRLALHDGTPGEVYNIGANCELTNLKLVYFICDTIDRLRPDLRHQPTRSLIEFVEDRPGHDRRYAIDSTKVQQELGWRPRYGFLPAMEKTIKWYLANQVWLRRVSLGCHQREPLGLAMGAD